MELVAKVLCTLVMMHGRIETFQERERRALLAADMRAALLRRVCTAARPLHARAGLSGARAFSGGPLRRGSHRLPGYEAPSEAAEAQLSTATGMTRDRVKKCLTV